MKLGMSSFRGRRTRRSGCGGETVVFLSAAAAVAFVVVVVVVAVFSGTVPFVEALSSSSSSSRSSSAGSGRSSSAVAGVVPEEEASFPVGSRILRLPTHGTRVRLLYPTTTAAAALAGASGGCVRDAPFSSSSAAFGRGRRPMPMPTLLVYSHDVGGNMDAATNLHRELASRGTIVAIPEHTDGTASPSATRPDGSEARFAPDRMTERLRLARRAQELLEAVDEVVLLLLDDDECDDDDDDHFFGDRPGPAVVLGGRGLGGASAVMAANGAPADAKAVVGGLLLHDPTLGLGYGILPPNRAYGRLPTVTYVSERLHRSGQIYGTRTLRVKGGRPRSFGDDDDLLWNPLLELMGRPDPEEVHRQLADSAVSFLRTLDADDPGISSGSLLETVR